MDTNIDARGPVFEVNHSGTKLHFTPEEFERLFERVAKAIYNSGDRFFSKPVQTAAHFAYWHKMPNDNLCFTALGHKDGENLQPTRNDTGCDGVQGYIAGSGAAANCPDGSKSVESKAVRTVDLLILEFRLMNSRLGNIKGILEKEIFENDKIIDDPSASLILRKYCHGRFDLAKMLLAEIGDKKEPE